MYSADKISVSILTFSRSRISKKNKTNYLTLTFDLEREGPTQFYMTFVIFGCIRDPRVVHGSDGPAGVGSGRVTILPDFGGSSRVGSALRIRKKQNQFKFFTDYFLVPESI